ncbi:hypothetical protein DENSPDRAFT_842841 [Dentipellis sp. KUC8613]|nr:hypothetical protein DENSPDRAFT_842841 [Dentipellis sp. KUC8613]
MSFIVDSVSLIHHSTEIYAFAASTRAWTNRSFFSLNASILALLTRFLRSLSARRAASSRSVSRPCLEDARVMSDPTDVAEVPNDECKCARDGRERRVVWSSSRRCAWSPSEECVCEDTESSRCIVGGSGASVSEATEYRELPLSEDEEDAAASENGDISFPGIESFFASASISGVDAREGDGSVGASSWGADVLAMPACAGALCPEKILKALARLVRRAPAHVPRCVLGVIGRTSGSAESESELVFSPLLLLPVPAPTPAEGVHATGSPSLTGGIHRGVRSP